MAFGARFGGFLVMMIGVVCLSLKHAIMLVGFVIEVLVGFLI